MVITCLAELSTKLRIISRVSVNITFFISLNEEELKEAL